MLKGFFSRRLPYPWVYSRSPWLAGLFGIALYVTIQTFRIELQKLPFWPKSTTVAVGDLIALPMFTAAAASAMKDFQPEKDMFYHHRWWFWLVGLLFSAGNTLNEVQNVKNGFPLRREFELGMMIHHISVLVYSSHILGVIPHLIRDVRGNKRAKLFALLAIIIYIGALAHDKMKGGSMAE